MPRLLVFSVSKLFLEVEDIIRFSFFVEGLVCATMHS
jgi:hypothetical protein